MSAVAAATEEDTATATRAAAIRIAAAAEEAALAGEEEVTAAADTQDDFEAFCFLLLLPHNEFESFWHVLFPKECNKNPKQTSPSFFDPHYSSMLFCESDPRGQMRISSPSLGSGSGARFSGAPGLSASHSKPRHSSASAASSSAVAST